MNDNVKNLLPGFVGGLTRTLISYPFDAIKTNMQQNQTGNTFNNIINLIKKDKMNFYRCSLPSFLIYPIDRAIQYSILEKYKDKYNTFILGFGIGTLSSIYMTPIQYITRNAILTDKKNYKNIFSFIKNISIKNMYSAFHLEYLKISLGACIYMGSYTTLRENIPNDYLVIMSPFLGGISSIINWSVIFPIDSTITNFVYNKQHNKDTNIVNIIKEKYKHRGLKSFYFGITPIYLRTLPTAMSSMFAYELTRNFIY